MTCTEFRVCKSRDAWPHSSQNPSWLLNLAILGQQRRTPTPSHPTNTHTHTPNSYEEQTDVHCRVTMLQSSVAALRWTCCHSDTDTGKWVKFQAFSSLWSRVLSGLHLLQLILHLACVARALCQTHRLWKNNLTGFNLPPSPHHHSPPFFLSHFSSVAFVCLWEEQKPFCLAAPCHSRLPAS